MFEIFCNQIVRGCNLSLLHPKVSNYSPPSSAASRGHTKPIQACECKNMREKCPLRPGSTVWQRSGSEYLTQQMCPMTKKCYTTTNSMDWILSLSLLFFSNFFVQFRFMQNVLRDFQKNYNMKIDHFLGHFSTGYS